MVRQHKTISSGRNLLYLPAEADFLSGFRKSPVFSAFQPLPPDDSRNQTVQNFFFRTEYSGFLSRKFPDWKDSFHACGIKSDCPEHSGARKPMKYNSGINHEISPWQESGAHRGGHFSGLQYYARTSSEI